MPRVVWRLKNAPEDATSWTGSFELVHPDGTESTLAVYDDYPTVKTPADPLVFSAFLNTVGVWHFSIFRGTQFNIVAVPASRVNTPLRAGTFTLDFANGVVIEERSWLVPAIVVGAGLLGLIAMTLPNNRNRR